MMLRGRAAGCTRLLLPSKQYIASVMWRIMLAILITPVMGQATATATSSTTFYSALTNREVTLIEIPPDNFQLIPADW